MSVRHLLHAVLVWREHEPRGGQQLHPKLCGECCTALNATKYFASCPVMVGHSGGDKRALCVAEE